MPSGNVSLTATYKDAAVNPTTYTLTINSGAGTGTYVQGQTVTIVANPAASGRVFSKWIGDTAYVSDVNASTATITMPNKAITLTATYVRGYMLTIANGSGSGMYARGRVITITANPAPSGMVFYRWTGSYRYAANRYSATTTVKMPGGSIKLTATYKVAPAVLGASIATVVNDGDLIKTADSPDIYIVKIKNSKQYKRLILSPNVFKSYKHLKWSSVKTVTKEMMNSFITSNLVKETSDTNIYQLNPDGDTGSRTILDTSKSYDADSVYEINKADRDSYGLAG
jgi:ribosomal protein L21E